MLPHNPLTMLGVIDRCWLLTYQTPEAAAREILPRELEPVTRAGCAFWNVVVCHLRAMRPKPLPALVGVSYWHVAYRLYARFHPASGPPLEGIFFVRSDCDSRLMAWLGNLLTDYRFHPAGIAVQQTAGAVRIEVDSKEAAADVAVERSPPERLPEHSAFASLEEAAAFLKYQPRGLSVSPDGRVTVVQIRRDEAAWNSRLVTVREAQWQFFTARDVRPEIAYEVAPIAYQWNRGETAR